MANDRSIPEKYKYKSIWSYSRLNTYLTCPHSYYLGYVKKFQGKENIYSSIGSLVHSICEDLQNKNINNEEAIAKFKVGYDEIVLQGVDFVREQEKNNFIYSIIDYFKNYKVTDGEGFKIEQKEFLEIDDTNVLLMFIDLIIKKNDDSIGVYDYKTSSKYTKKDLVKNGKQLVLYAYTLLKNYPKYKNVDLAWFMLKYVNVTYNKRTTQISRHALVTELKDKIFKELEKLDIVDLEANEIYCDAISNNEIPDKVKDKFIIEDSVVPYEYNEETIKETLDFIINTIRDINSDKEFKPVEINEKNNFFCNVLCGQSLNCEALKKYNETEADKNILPEEGDLF